MITRDAGVYKGLLHHQKAHELDVSYQTTIEIKLAKDIISSSKFLQATLYFGKNLYKEKDLYKALKDLI